MPLVIVRQRANQQSGACTDGDALPGVPAALVTADPTGPPAQQRGGGGLRPNQLRPRRQERGGQRGSGKQVLHRHNTVFDVAVHVLFAGHASTRFPSCKCAAGCDEARVSYSPRRPPEPGRGRPRPQHSEPGGAARVIRPRLLVGAAAGQAAGCPGSRFQ
jgi:hypothetical protein